MLQKENDELRICKYVLWYHIILMAGRTSGGPVKCQKFPEVHFWKTQSKLKLTSEKLADQTKSNVANRCNALSPGA